MPFGSTDRIVRMSLAGNRARLLLVTHPDKVGPNADVPPVLIAGERYERASTGAVERCTLPVGVHTIHNCRVEVVDATAAFPGALYRGVVSFQSLYQSACNARPKNVRCCTTPVHVTKRCAPGDGDVVVHYQRRAAGAAGALERTSTVVPRPRTKTPVTVTLPGVGHQRSQDGKLVAGSVVVTLRGPISQYDEPRGCAKRARPSTPSDKWSRSGRRRTSEPG
ncbi:MAG: hypothetical protein ACPGR8_14935 [Limisphaerales bacterium]